MAFPDGEELNQLAINRSTEVVSTTYVGLTTEEGSLLTVRTRGAIVTALALRAQETGEVAPMLYCDTAPTAATKAKPRASHAMVPVGPAPDEVGGKHGFPRYADYQYASLEDGNGLTATMHYYGPRIPGFERHFMLGAATMMMKDQLTARSMGYAGSMGHHNYHTVPNGALGELRVNGQPLAEVLGDDDAIAKIEDGHAQFWPHFRGRASFSHPTDGGDRRFYVNAAAQVMDAVGDRRLPASATGMLFWRAAGTTEDYLAIEPVVGVDVAPDGTFHNTGLGIAPFGTAVFTTTIGLIS